MTSDTPQTLSRRDYFAAHAPMDIPAWFKLDFRPRPELPDPSTLAPEHRKQWDGLGDWLSEDEVAPEVLAFRKRYLAGLEADDRYAQEFSQAEFIAWRWHYADMIIAATALTSSHSSDAHIDTALCVWEHLLERSLTDPDIRHFRTDIGTAELRIAAIRLAEFCVEVYNRLPHAMTYGHTYDWDIIPAIMDTIDWRARPLDLPDTNTAAETVKDALSEKDARA